MLARTATVADAIAALDPDSYHRPQHIRKAPLTDMVELPTADSEEEMWRALGFEELPPRYPDQKFVEFDVQGVYKRLMAGIRSLRMRGFHSSEIIVSDGHLCWESTSGFWSRRSWTVTARVKRDDMNVVCSDVSIEVKSADQQSAEGTIFTGGALDVILERRLAWAVPIIGARATEPTTSLTDEEVDAYHDLHPSPVKAWSNGTGRVVLEDDDHGSAHLTTHGDVDEILASLRERGWQIVCTDRRIYTQ
jgi:hypothetical protein